MQEIKMEMKKRAKLNQGLVNRLAYDAECIFTDVSNFDIICMNESIESSKNTLEKLFDSIVELEYLLYLVKDNSSRKKHTPL